MTTLATRSGGFPSATPTKLLPARPTTNRKRAISEEASTPSSVKRSKVSFNSNVEVRVVEEWEKTPELIQEEVGRALEKQAWGDDSSYLEVKAIYSAKKRTEDEPSTNTLRNYTVALLSNVSSLNKSRSDLVYAVLNSPWLGRSEEYTNVYTRFLANLVCAQGIYLADALRMLVDNLTASKSFSTNNKK
jgi:RNA polymerase I-specific transcription initiation factor RRN3